VQRRHKQSTTVLIADREPDAFHHVPTILTASGFRVISADTRRAVRELVEEEPVAAVVTGMSLRDGTGIDLVRELRLNDETAEIPVIFVAKDDEDSSFSITALNAGADDFVVPPFIGAALVARLRRALQRLLHANLQAGSMQLSAGELPGILQFLGTEEKSGRVVVESGDHEVVIYVAGGRLTDAVAPGCDGEEAVAEALCWESATVTFHECEIEAEHRKYEAPVTGTVMNAAVVVDEFRELRDTFLNGPELDTGERRPADGESARKALWDYIVTGWQVQELLTEEAGQRSLLGCLRDMLDDGELTHCPAPFEDHGARCREQYKSTHYERKLQAIKETVAGIDLYPAERMVNRGGKQGSVDWMLPAPCVLISGNKVDHAAQLIATIREISGRDLEIQAAERRLHGCRRTRVDFGDQLQIEFLELPAELKPKQIERLRTELLDICAAIFIVSGQDAAANTANARLLRVLWRMFSGVYYFVVPEEVNEQEEAPFAIGCTRCGESLLIDMRRTGEVGECPMCRTQLVIPDVLAQLSHIFQLPDEIPGVMMRPGAEEHARDLVLFVIDHVLHALQAPSEPPPAPVDEDLEKTSTQLMSNTSLRRRPKKELKVRATAPQEVLEFAEEQPAADDEEAEQAAADADGEAPDALDEIFGDMEDTQIRTQKLDHIDAVLGDTTDFNIDDFIRNVKGD
jgi:CheY-like chemotaxis protein